MVRLRWRQTTTRVALPLAFDGGFDVAVGLVDGDEDVIGIVPAEGGQIGEQVMQVGHGELDVGNFRGRIEGGFAHVE
jgi:hypothetical protein